jgi:paraquat-inducible protein A
MTTNGRTAREAGLITCHSCHLLCPPQEPLVSGRDDHGRCPRCGAALHFRKKNSLSRTWALTLAAAIFYIPANLLPITVTTSLAGTQTDTIMSGVIYFMMTGMWPIALVIFTASVLVPILKLIILIFLLLTVHLHTHWRRKDRTRLYRITELVGRWSMVDIYVVTILIALVHLGALADMDAGLGAVFFGAVVVITMFAAESFDPRLIWDVGQGSPRTGRDATAITNGGTHVAVGGHPREER